MACWIARCFASANRLKQATLPTTSSSWQAGKAGQRLCGSPLPLRGLRLDELAITVEEGQLIVRGQQAEERHRDFLYRGIAKRRYKRGFELANGAEVRTAELQNGLLA
jgi:hypothetical protein